MAEIHAMTDIGRHRKKNEDCFLINDFIANSGNKHILVEGDFITAVADGVGGYNAGEIASHLALEQLSGKYNELAKDSSISAINNLTRFSEDILSDTILDAHHNILAYGSRYPEARGLCATIAGILCVENKITVFHVGDSRVYRFRDGRLKRLTRDHSLVQVLFDSGKITREAMLNHSQKHIILQSVGGKNESINAEIQCLRSGFEAGDIFIICTDGLTDMVKDEVIEEILACEDTSTAVKELIVKANEKGGHDNVTIVAVSNNKDGIETHTFQ